MCLLICFVQRIEECSGNSSVTRVGKVCISKCTVRRLILWLWNCLWWTDFRGTVRLIDLCCFALNKRAYNALISARAVCVKLNNCNCFVRVLKYLSHLTQRYCVYINAPFIVWMCSVVLQMSVHIQYSDSRRFTWCCESKGVWRYHYEGQWIRSLACCIPSSILAWLWSAEGNEVWLCFLSQPTQLTNVLEISNIVFTSMFVLEMLFKLLAFGTFGYIKNPYNIFDGIIVVIR